MSIVASSIKPSETQAQTSLVSKSLADFFKSSENRDARVRACLKVIEQAKDFLDDGENEAYVSEAQNYSIPLAAISGHVSSIDEIDDSSAGHRKFRTADVIVRERLYRITVTSFVQVFQGREQRKLPIRYHMILDGTYILSEVLVVGDFVTISASIRPIIVDNALVYQCQIYALVTVCSAETFAKTYDLPFNWYSNHLQDLATQRAARQLVSKQQSSSLNEIIPE